MSTSTLVKPLPEEMKAPNIDISDEEFEEYLKSLDDLCLLEASTLKRNIDDAIRQWNLCQAALNSMNSDEIDSKLNRSIMEANVLESVNVNTAEEFATDYEKSVNRLQQVSDKLLGIIDAHKDELDSTVFMTNQMLTIIKKKIATLDKASLNYAHDLKAAETIKKSFENRLIGGNENLAFLSDKLDNYLITHRKEISRSFRSEAKLVRENQKTKAIKALCRQFSENSIARFIYKLNEAFAENSATIFVFINFIAYMLKNGRDSGQDTYAKLLILDLVDMYNGIYDVPNRSSVDYLNDLDFMCSIIGAYNRIHKFCISDKNNNDNAAFTFGLPKPSAAPKSIQDIEVAVDDTTSAEDAEE